MGILKLLGFLGLVHDGLGKWKIGYYKKTIEELGRWVGR